MKSKTARLQHDAGRAAIEAYIDSMIRDCHADDPIAGCPDCRAAYIHARRYYEKTFKERT